MPPKTDAPPKPGAKGAKGKGLGKRVGPFPLWLWIAGGAGVAFIAYLYLRNSSGSASMEDVPALETVTGSGYTPQDAASAGAPAGVTPPGEMLDPGVMEAIYSVSNELRDVRDSLDAQALAYEGLSYDQSIPTSPEEATLATTLGPPGSAPAQKTKKAVPSKKAPYGYYRDSRGRLTPKGPPKKKASTGTKTAARPAGINYGRGTYRDSQGRLTYKGPAPKAKPKAKVLPQTKKPPPARKPVKKGRR